MEHINLPVLDNSGEREVTREVLEVEPLGTNTFRLLHSPALINGLASGDVITLAPESLPGFSVKSRGGNIAVLVAFESDELKQTLVNQIAASVRALGGEYEGGPTQVGVFTVPVKAGFPRIERLFAKLAKPVERQLVVRQRLRPRWAASSLVGTPRRGLLAELKGQRRC